VDTATEALVKLDQRTRTSYLIGYEPSNPDLDDKYRRVRVEVNRPNVTVLYRDGYFASEEMAPGDLKEKVARIRADSALASDASATGIGVRAAVDIAHALGLEAVAEGVASMEMLRRLDALGCDMAQGFAIAMPMRPEDVLPWVRARQRPLRVMSGGLPA
jgi:hypothetical protein